ncbi:MAG: MFS transporter, partial [Usitatibacter sp.]
PLVGRSVDRRGGRVVLSAGSLLGAGAMALLACASGPATLMAGWALAGAAMSACLYDPAFATLAQHMAAARFRKAVTLITILGGFASTVFWPVSQLMLDTWGWRTAFGVYAGLHLLVCLPIHLLVIPDLTRAVTADAATAIGPTASAPPRRGLGWLTVAVGAASFVSSVIAVHAVSLLVAQGLTQAQAIWIAMLIGPMQVAGRIAEFGFASRIGVVALGRVAFALMIVAALAILAIEGFGIAAFVFVVAFGWGNGLFTIVRGTAPAELFGRVDLGALLGHLARAGLYSRALAPASFSGMLAVGLTRNAALATLAVVALGALASYSLAVRGARAGKSGQN